MWYEYVISGAIRYQYFVSWYPAFDNLYIALWSGKHVVIDRVYYGPIYYQRYIIYVHGCDNPEKAHA